MKNSDEVVKILKALPKAPEELQTEAVNELVLNVRKDPRRQRSLDMLKDYDELTEKFKREGYHVGSTWHVVRKWITSFLMFAFGLWMCKHINWFVGAVFCGAVAQGAFWFAVHESGHRSFSTYPWLDKVFQYLFFDLFFGASTRFWNLQHNHHHANTQHKDFDTDLHYYPFIYFSRLLFDAPGHGPGGKKKAGWWVENQGNTWWVSLILLQIWYQYWHHTKYNLHKKTYEYFFLGFVTHYSFHFYLLNHLCGFSLLKTILIMHTYLFICGGAIFVQSWFSHTFMNIHMGCPPLPKEEQDKVPRYHYNWVELAAYHTVNMTPSFFVNLFCGFLTIQIQHHLWPSIPEANQGEHTKKLIKEFFKRHDLPYYEQSYTRSFFDTWNNVTAVGKNVPYPGPFNQLNK